MPLVGLYSTSQWKFFCFNLYQALTVWAGLFYAFLPQVELSPFFFSSIDPSFQQKIVENGSFTNSFFFPLLSLCLRASGVSTL